MTDTMPEPVAGRTPWMVGFLMAAMVCNVFVIVTVNFWIYYARVSYIATHPERVAVQPPTISRAISDPAIGEPFAFWITLSAILLFFGVLGISFVVLQLRRCSVFRNTVWGRVLLIGAIAGTIFQGSSAIGMYMLSSFRFPNHNGMHMIGSVLFFAAQTLVIVVGVIYCLVLLRNRHAMAALEDAGFTQRRWLVLRFRLGVATIALAVLYSVLFLGKGYDLGAFNTLFYAVYVQVEPIVITMFLLFLGMFQMDVYAALRWRSLDRLAAPARPMQP